MILQLVAKQQLSRVCPAGALQNACICNMRCVHEALGDSGDAQSRPGRTRAPGAAWLGLSRSGALLIPVLCHFA